MRESETAFSGVAANGPLAVTAAPTAAKAARSAARRAPLTSLQPTNRAVLLPLGQALHCSWAYADCKNIVRQHMTREVSRNGETVLSELRTDSLRLHAFIRKTRP